MFLIVLRSLLVYGGTAAVFLVFVDRFVTPLRRRMAILLACAPALFVGKALLTGGVYAPLDHAYYFPPLAAHGSELGVVGVRTPFLGDVVASYLPGLKAVRESVKNGRLPLWNRFQAAGEPLLAFQQPAVLYPGTWIGFLLPLAQAWTFGIALRFLIALVSAYAFFRELRCGELPSLLGAAAWAFCDHVTFFIGFSVGAAVTPFPLLLLGLRRLTRDPDRTAVGITVAALTLIAVAGHPETLLHCVAGGGVYFLFELLSAPPKRRLGALALALLAGSLTLGLTAVVLLPLREILPATQQGVNRHEIYAKQKKSVEIGVAGYRSLRNLLPFGIGLAGRAPAREPVQLPAAYAGSLILPLAVVGLFSNRREKWAFAVLTLLGLALWARVAGVTDVVSRLPLFDIAVNDYLVFLAAFGAVALAVLGAQSLQEGRRSAVFAVAALGTAAAMWLIYVSVQSDLDILVNVPEQQRRYKLLAIAPLVAAAAAVWALRRGAGTLRVGAVLLLLLVQRRLEAGPINPDFPNRAFYPPLDVLEGLPRGIPERIVAVGHVFVPNVSSLYEFEDARAYEAMTLGAFHQTYPLWCIAQPVWYNRVDDLRRPFLSFLNVRYAMTPLSGDVPPGWRVVRGGSGVRVLENPGVLPRAFAPFSIRYEADPQRQLEDLRAIEDFRREGVVGTPGPPGWSRNGGADVRVTGYTGQHMSLRIDAAREALVATSIPGWPGWRLRLDGRRVPLLPYNRAFLAFRVPAGVHEARLDYLPDGFVWGAAISAATIGLLGVLALRGAARRSRESASAR